MAGKDVMTGVGPLMQQLRNDEFMEDATDAW